MAQAQPGGQPQPGGNGQQGGKAEPPKQGQQQPTQPQQQAAAGPQRPKRAKIGAGHAAAMGRLGLKELRNAVSPSKDSVAADEIGVFGTQTQGEIAQGRGGPGSGPEQEQPAQAAQEGPDVQGNEQGGKKADKVQARLARMKGTSQSRSRGR